jgi:polyisoprenoid-binding protein YceI
VTADLTFHGVTNEVTAHLDYVGKVNTGSSEDMDLIGFFHFGYF